MSEQMRTLDPRFARLETALEALPGMYSDTFAGAERDVSPALDTIAAIAAGDATALAQLNEKLLAVDIARMRSDLTVTRGARALQPDVGPMPHLLDIGIAQVEAMIAILQYERALAADEPADRLATATSIEASLGDIEASFALFDEALAAALDAAQGMPEGGLRDQVIRGLANLPETRRVEQGFTEELRQIASLLRRMDATSVDLAPYWEAIYAYGDHSLRLDAERRAAIAGA